MRMVDTEAGIDLAACLVRVRQRDEDAARALLQHLHPLVLKIVRSHLPRRTSEEDLVQTVFMKVFAKLDQYQAQAPFEHWVARIAVNTCLNQLENERLRPEWRHADLSEDELLVVDHLSTSAEDLAPSADVGSRELVEKLLARLKPKDRLLMTLLYLEGRTLDEVREITGWNIALIKIRSFRARHQLKKDLDYLMKESKP
jgi:RNA polymerase sigma factor (sigma-70 family)